ncbi:MAG: lysine 5,6-aminomutase subunit alpha [Polyangiaceae bacterium]
MGRALLAGAKTVQEAGERLAFGHDLDDGTSGPSPEQIARALAPHAKAAIERIDRAKDEREANKRALPPGPTPLKYVIVATGNIYDDALQAKAAAHGGADIVAAGSRDRAVAARLRPARRDH